MIEFLVAAAISLVLIAAAVAAFTDALRSNEMVHLAAVGATPACNGTISPTGDSVTFDPACNDLSKARVPIKPGDLILFTNPAGATAIQTVTTVNGQQLNFAGNTNIDKFGFNQTRANQGTILQLQSSPGTWPPITATRIFMITYYLDNVADPLRPRLMRQLNFNIAQPVGDVVEALTVRYNFVDGNTPPTFFAKQSTVPPGLSESNIRSVNVFLGARSNRPQSRTSKYLRDNMSTQLSLRSLSYFNRYQ